MTKIEMVSKITSVTMVSGGKSSAYMALNYPTDRYLFTPVLANDENCLIKDKSLRTYCQDKISWFDWNVYGSRELDLTLENLRRLEQTVGKEIEWIAYLTFDDVINHSLGDIRRCFNMSHSKTPMLPSKTRRTCTEVLKIYTGFWHLYLTSQSPVSVIDDKRAILDFPYLVNLGYRYDEEKRVNSWKCDQINVTLKCDISGKFKNKHRKTKVDYRYVTFPMYENRITKEDVALYWHKKGWSYPKVSNCDGCMFHTDSEMLYQSENHPNRLVWWTDWENKTGHTFDKKSVYSKSIGTDIETKTKTYTSCVCGD